MLNTLFQGVFTSTTTIQIPQFLLCIAVSLAIGLFLSFLYMHKSHYTKSFVVTLALLPAVVCVVIMMVNGNVGAGVAVAGAFSLVRFRSGKCKRNRNHFSCDGSRTDQRHGLPRLRGAFFPCGRSHNVPFKYQPLWNGKRRKR